MDVRLRELYLLFRGYEVSPSNHGRNFHGVTVSVATQWGGITLQDFVCEFIDVCTHVQIVECCHYVYDHYGYNVLCRKHCVSMYVGVRGIVSQTDQQQTWQATPGLCWVCV